MTLKECYAALGGDYDDAVSRFQGERLVQKFVLRFLEDSSHDALCRSLEAEDYAEAFRASHTLKGLSQTLGFTELSRSSDALTEALRTGPQPGVPTLAAQVKEDYSRAVSAIRQYQESGRGPA